MCTHQQPPKKNEVTADLYSHDPVRNPSLTTIRRCLETNGVVSKPGKAIKIKKDYH